MARGRADSTLLVGGLAAIIATATTLGLPASSAQPAPTYSETLTNCRVVDGDTLRCDGGRVRLLGIDAPELPGHCAPNRDCAPGDAFESTESLR